MKIPLVQTNCPANVYLCQWPIMCYFLQDNGTPHASLGNGGVGDREENHLTRILYAGCQYRLNKQKNTDVTHDSRVPTGKISVL